MGDEPGGIARFTAAAKWSSRRDGTAHATLTKLDKATATLERPVVAASGDSRLNLEYRDREVVVAADAGESLFNNTSRGVRSGCAVCHSPEPGIELVGPSLAGIAARAGSTDDGLDAAEYLRQSILDPDAFVVPGYPAGQMLQDTASRLTEAQIDQLVAFMLTLEDE